MNSLDAEQTGSNSVLKHQPDPAQGPKKVPSTSPHNLSSQAHSAEFI
jgi:hypothetical protein